MVKPPTSLEQSPLADFVALYALLYCGFGVASPFLPALLHERGVPAETIGVLFAAGTAVRLLSAPIVGTIADHTHALRLTLALCAIATAFAATGYAAAAGAFWPLLVVSLLHASAVAPTTNLADALASVASRRQKPLGFEYGWVRGAGSAAFIVGSTIAGLAIGRLGMSVIIWLQVLLLLAVPFAVMGVPAIRARSGSDLVSRGDIMALLRVAAFRRIVLVAALIMGSHALHDTFSVIRWKDAGISPQTISILWSLSVAAEVLVFFVVGPWLLRRLTPAMAIALAALAGAVRWFVAACTIDIAASSLIQLLHGITFALLHLACMRLLTQAVPDALAATAQALYGTVGVGVATALLTVASGWLYARVGAAAFAAMGALCLAALPLTRSLAAARTLQEHP